MKKRITALFLSIVFAFTALGAHASVLGSETLYTMRIPVGKGTYYNKNIVFSDQAGVNRQTEYFFEYLPNEDVTPAIINDWSLYGKRTIVNMAGRLDDKNPIMMMNADFFSFATGVPMSNMVMDGEIITALGGFQSAIGFNEDGTAFVSDVAINAGVRVGEESFPIYNINKYPQPKSWYLLTDRFGDQTHSAAKATKILIGQLDGRLKANDTVTGVVESVIYSEESTPISHGQIILFLEVDDSDESDEANALREQLALFEEGAQVSFSTEVIEDERWSSAKYILGCTGGRLLADGEIVTPDEAAAPRTAIGVRADGSVVFYAIDGRQPGKSYGLRLPTLARRLKELGCVDAVNLDGGGSTSVMGRMPGGSAMSLLNSPSDGAPRAVANFVGLIDYTMPTGRLTHLYLTPYYEKYLVGASQTISAVGADDNFHPMDIDGDVILTSEDDVLIEGMNVTFLQEGEITINAKAGKAQGSITYPVYSTPDRVELVNEDNNSPIRDFTFRVEDVINFRARAAVGNAYLVCNDRCFTWEVEGDIGEIDSEGVFRATKKAAKGKILVSAGDKTEVFNVNIVNEDIYEVSTYTTGEFYEDEDYVNLKLMNVDEIPVDQKGIKAYLDGEDADFSFDGETVSIKKPNDSMHKVRVNITNSLGKTKMFIHQIDGHIPSRGFMDTSSHWGEKIIDYMSEMGIISGFKEDDGTYIFMPDKQMTRGEFAVMLTRYLNLEEKDFSNVALSFSDANLIPSWGKNAVCAMTDIGLINGKIMEDESIAFDFASNITRGEVVAILARILPKDLMRMEITLDDLEDVPWWAMESFEIMLAQGIMSGYDDNTLQPLREITRAEALKLLFNIL